MHGKLESRLLAAVFAVMAFVGMIAILKGGYRMMPILKAFAFFIPLLLVAGLGMSKVWPGLVLGSLVLMAPLPTSVLRRFEGGMIIIGLVCALAFVRTAARHGSRRILCGLDGYCMLAVALVVCGRFVYDRPGSAQLGATGGAGEAVVFVMAVLAYFAVAMMGSEDWSSRTNLRTAVLLAVIFTVMFTINAFVSHGSTGFLTLFKRHYWFLCSVMLAWTYQCNSESAVRHLRIAVLPYLAIIVTFLMGVISPHRSRPIFAAGMVLSVSYLYRRVRQAVPVFVVGGVAIILMVLVVRSGQLPVWMTRTLSTVMPVESSEIRSRRTELRVSAEVGWRSGFRKELYLMGWRHIKRHPIAGKGFAFSRGEIIAAVAASHSADQRFQALVLSGSYHNSVFQLAVTCGLPCALLFLIAYFSGLAKFVGISRGMKDPHLRIFCAGMTGLFVAESGQMFMNGASHSFFVICVLLGLMKGITTREHARTGTDAILDHNPEP